MSELNENEKEICEADLTVKELGIKLKNLPNNKTPGSDGLCAEFYKFFWKDSKEILYLTCLNIVSMRKS